MPYVYLDRSICYCSIQMMIHLLDSLPTRRFVAAWIKIARPTPCANNCKREKVAHDGEQWRSRRQSVPPEHLARPIYSTSAPELSRPPPQRWIAQNGIRSRWKSHVCRGTSPQIYVIVEGKRDRPRGRESENDEGRESARGMEAAWTENGSYSTRMCVVMNRAGWMQGPSDARRVRWTWMTPDAIRMFIFDGAISLRHA